MTVALSDAEYAAVRFVASVKAMDEGPFLRSLCMKPILREFDRLMRVTKSVR